MKRCNKGALASFALIIEDIVTNLLLSLADSGGQQWAY
jgi:hypothetical protein